MNVEKAIWNAYLDDPCRLFSIRELSLHLKKSYPLIHQHITRLISQNKLSSTTIGKSILCYPNYNNAYTLLSLALADQERTIESSSSNILLQELFSKKIFDGLLCAFLTKNELVIVSSQKNTIVEIKSFLSQTTFMKKVEYIVMNSNTDISSFLLDKQTVLFGYEQFHLLIRKNYATLANKNNLVKLHE